jgi:hypothetical protein
MKEALELALEAFQRIFESTPPYREDGTCTINDTAIKISNKAIIAIKETLAQPAQEPVASMTVEDGRISFAAKILPDGTYDLYTKPQQRPWVGLTDEEASWCQAPSTIQTWKRIETKLKEKNT